MTREEIRAAIKWSEYSLKIWAAIVLILGIALNLTIAFHRPTRMLLSAMVSDMLGEPTEFLANSFNQELYAGHPHRSRPTEITVCGYLMQDRTLRYFRIASDGCDVMFVYPISYRNDVPYIHFDNGRMVVR